MKLQSRVCAWRCVVTPQEATLKKSRKKLQKNNNKNKQTNTPKKKKKKKKSRKLTKIQPTNGQN